MDENNKMDKGQKKTVQSNLGPYLVLAGPGSGKTTVITHRIKYLIEEKNIDPSKILVMTFTKNAANEMESRTIKLCGEASGNVCFGTFHSISLMILREEKGITDGDIMSESERRNIIVNLCKKYFADREDKKTFLKEAALDLSLAQGSPDKFIPHICKANDFEPFFKEYIKTIRNTGRLTFDDMLYDCVELLENDADCLKKWQVRWDYIMVDEYQDSNPIQEKELQLLAYPQNNIMVVGDDDQSIYGFRGADPEVMLSFPKHFKKAKTIHLATNYRSTDQIILASKILIDNNVHRYTKEPVGNKGLGDEVFIKRESNAEWQGKTIVNEIKKMKANKIPYKHMAIIYRTNREAGNFVELLYKSNIPFVVKDNVENIYEHWIAKDIFSYIQLAMGFENEELLKRIINRPKRYVEKSLITSLNPFTIDNIRNYYKDNCKPYICDALDELEKNIVEIKEVLKRNSSYDAVNIILDKIGYAKFLEDRAIETNVSIDELNSVKEELLSFAGQHNNINEWFSYIKKYTNELKNNISNSNEDSVSLMTMHGAKGLEYEAVFVPNLIEGQVPYTKAKTVEEIEEERRMFYVAITRAKSKLFLLSVRIMNGKETQQSRFIKEITKGLERIKLDEAKSIILETANRNKGRIENVEIKETEQNKQTLIPTVLPDNLIKDAPLTHKNFGKGFLQSRDEKRKKLTIFFPLINKNVILDETFCLKTGLVLFDRKEEEKIDG